MSYINCMGHNVKLIYSKHYLDRLQDRTISSNLIYNKIYEGLPKLIKIWERDKKILYFIIISNSTDLNIVCSLWQNIQLELHIVSVVKRADFKRKHRTDIRIYVSNPHRKIEFDPTVNNDIVKDLVMKDIGGKFRHIKEDGLYA